MKINILSDYLKFKKIFGVNGAMTAAKNLAEALSKHAEVIINGEDGDIINSHGCFPYTYHKMKKFKEKGKPIIINAHQTHYDTKNAVRLSRIMTPLAKRYLKKYYSKADLLITPTKNSKRIIEQELNKNKTKIEVVTNGVKTKNFARNKKKRESFRKKWNLNNLTIMSVGMPVKRKGFPSFKKIAAELKDYEFIWVGQPSFPLFQGKKSSQQENLTLTGYVKDLSEAYSGADIFCFPSHYEGQGIVILEAAANGLPIIVRDLPAYNEWLKDGYNCLKARTDEELKDKIKCLKNNPSEMKKLSKASLKLAKNNDINLTAKKQLKIFKRFL